MLNAIDDYTIYGVKTTLPFCKFALDHPDILIKSQVTSPTYPVPIT